MPAINGRENRGLKKLKSCIKYKPFFDLRGELKKEVEKNRL
jgi:hypothetical protein